MNSGVNDYCEHCNQMTTLPVRSSWARMVLTKAQSNERLQNIDRRSWYCLSRIDLLDEQYRVLFELFDEDDETKEFLNKSQEKSDNIPIQMFHSFFSSLLTVFIARTSGIDERPKYNRYDVRKIFLSSANGLLGRGRMFVYSREQFRKLLGFENEQVNKFRSLLDIGAADGAVTERMSQLFEQVYVTEMSSIMQWRLSNCGFTILDIEDWADTKFDVISCLNVLDRCEKPLSLLKKIRDHLNPVQGQLIIALVLPFRAYCEYNHDHLPNEAIHLDGRVPEEQINELMRTVFEPLGFFLKKLTRLPYLCEGDLEQSFYFLSDYIFVLGVKSA